MFYFIPELQPISTHLHQNRCSHSRWPLGWVKLHLPIFITCKLAYSSAMQDSSLGVKIYQSPTQTLIVKDLQLLRPRSFSSSHTSRRERLYHEVILKFFCSRECAWLCLLEPTTTLILSHLGLSGHQVSLWLHRWCWAASTFRDLRLHAPSKRSCSWAKRCFWIYRAWWSLTGSPRQSIETDCRVLWLHCRTFRRTFWRAQVRLIAFQSWTYANCLKSALIPALTHLLR